MKKCVVYLVTVEPKLSIHTERLTTIQQKVNCARPFCYWPLSRVTPKLLHLWSTFETYVMYSHTVQSTTNKFYKDDSTHMDRVQIRN